MRLLVLLFPLIAFLFANPASSSEPENEAASQADQLAYSNTLGTSATAYGQGVTITDDITITGDQGCLLSRIEFDVTGNTDGFGAGPYAVDFELFDGCPEGGGSPIEGSRGRVSFPNAGAFQASLNIPPSAQIVLPRTFWLAVTFDRDHAGWIGGAPALVGYSDDWFSFPFIGCAFSLGGYPTAPHSSMNARVYVRPGCPEIHAGYHAKTPRRGPYNPGGGVRMADDITLDGPCMMVGYEVTTRGTALYEMDLRTVGVGGLPGPVIGGTSRSIQHFGSLIKTLRAGFDPPIALPERFWFTIAADSGIGRTLISGLPARIGQSDSGYAVFNGTSWQSATFPLELANGAFELSILCDGPAVQGACCDMQFPDENGDAVCREVPRANCPYPAPESELLPAWKSGASCAPDPFDTPCGASACCLADGTCTNLTESECAPRGVSWTRGVYCGSPEIDCRPMCIMSDQPCTSAHPQPGCINPYCCAAVCGASGQSFCCNVEWDRSCVNQASQLCGLIPPNDECFSEVAGEGARLLTTTSSADADVLNATENKSDPGFCCHGTHAGATGVGSVWFRFAATSATMRLRTCQSSAPASDSLIQVFQAADSSSPQAACTSLRSIGCGDDAASCSAGGHNSVVCLRNLTVGRTYYVMVAAKDEKSRGVYTLSLSASCSDPVPPVCACPSGSVEWLDPPTGAVDARRPHARTGSGGLEGLQSFVVRAPLGSDQVACWQLCDTALPAAPNQIESVVPLGAGIYSLSLQRPISPGAVTTLTLNGDPATRGVFYSHPANVSADSAAAPSDLLDLIDALNGIRFLPWEDLSGDIDRSGVVGPADIIETIDLLNGSGGFQTWNGTALPDATPCTMLPPSQTGD